MFTFVNATYCTFVEIGALLLTDRECESGVAKIPTIFTPQQLLPV